MTEDLELYILRQLEMDGRELDIYELRDRINNEAANKLRSTALTKVLTKCEENGEIWFTAESETYRIMDAGMIRLIENDLLPSEQIHSCVKRAIHDIGLMLGIYSQEEYREAGYSYDVIWKQAEFLPRASHVFEIQHKGSVAEALVRLKHAFDIWGSKLFLVVTQEKDKRKVKTQFGPVLLGAFHEIANETSLLCVLDIVNFWRYANQYRIMAEELLLRPPPITRLNSLSSLAGKRHIRK